MSNIFLFVLAIMSNKSHREMNISQRKADNRTSPVKHSFPVLCSRDFIRFTLEKERLIFIVDTGNVANIFKRWFLLRLNYLSHSSKITIIYPGLFPSFFTPQSIFRYQTISETHIH